MKTPFLNRLFLGRELIKARYLGILKARHPNKHLHRTDLRFLEKP